ncbi:HNH endonuclease [Sinorhizobium sp. GL2]|nr:HNH endonuclease [Sinorhizobium sp. GL2]
MEDKVEHPSLQYLHECFDLDASKGELRWKQRPVTHFVSKDQQKRMNSRLAGKVAGYRTKKEKRQCVTVDGKAYLSSRLVYALHHDIPLSQLPDLIDHKDCDTQNDRPSNLRPATHVQNNGNQKLSSNNTSGLKGATWNKRLRKWSAQIRVHGKLKHLGLFDDPAEAHAAYLAAAKRHFGEFARAA